MDELEVEIKVWLKRTRDHFVQTRAAKDMEDLLVESGFEKEGDVEHRDLYFSHPSRDFAATDEALRMRTVKDMIDGRPRFFMTYKGPKLSGRSKARVEKEVRIASFDDTREIFYSLGFKKVMVVEKKRITFSYNDIVACIDILPDLGCFLEIEVMDTDIERGEARLLELLRDWEMDSFERRSYLELLLEDDVN